MGNSARVIFGNRDRTSLSPIVYLHWNGSHDSMYAFLKRLENVGWHDHLYAAGRFCQIVGDFVDDFGFTPSNIGLGVENWSGTLTGIKTIDSDNGVYLVVCERGEILVSRFLNGGWIVNRMPLSEMYRTLSADDQKKSDAILKAFDDSERK